MAESTPRPPAWSTLPKLDLLPDPTAPLYTLDADELARQLETEHGSEIAGRTMYGLSIAQALAEGCSFDEALTIAENIADDVAMSSAMKASWVGAAVLLRTDPKAKEELRNSRASSDN